MTNPLEYVPAEVPGDCILKISPSAFSHFIDKPHRWYRQEILKEDPFSHNTSTVLGTIVHYCAEKVAKKESVRYHDIEEYIDMLEAHDDYCPTTVRANWELMAEAVVNGYVMGLTDIHSVESQVCRHIKDGIYAAGTYDLLRGPQHDALLADYKSYNSKSKPKSIAYYYKYQLLVYAWILREYDIAVNRIQIIAVNRNIEGEISEKTGKRLKSYPPEATVMTEVITEEDINFIESMLELCADSYLATQKNPELTHLIWHDPRLKV